MTGQINGMPSSLPSDVQADVCNAWATVCIHETESRPQISKVTTLAVLRESEASAVGSDLQGSTHALSWIGRTNPRIATR
jgi:hypothetical protein